MAGFTTDIMRVLRRYNILHYVEDFCSKEVFPSKSSWKSIVKFAMKELNENEWREKFIRNSQLKLYAMVHQKLETIFWWYLARQYPDYLGEITDVLHILCGSYTLRGNRIEDSENISTECERCHMLSREPLKHALLYCTQPKVERIKYVETG